MVQLGSHWDTWELKKSRMRHRLGMVIAGGQRSSGACVYVYGCPGIHGPFPSNPWGLAAGTSESLHSHGVVP